MALDIKIEDFKKWVAEHPEKHVFKKPENTSWWACGCPVAQFLKSTRPDSEVLVSKNSISVYASSRLLADPVTYPTPDWVRSIVLGVDGTVPHLRTRELVLELIGDSKSSLSP